MKNCYPTSEKMNFLLSMINNRVMGLPEFQRDFVWDPYATDELIESIIQNFPAGSLLRIKNGTDLLFEPRAFKGAPPFDEHIKPAYLILDGQQRLTSLYQALYGVGDHLYYLNLEALRDGGDLEDCAFYLPKKEGQKRYGTIEQQAKELIFPLGNTFSNGGFSSWVSQILKERGQDVSSILALQEELGILREKWVKPIEDYEFPMVTLDDNTPGEAICTIFETLNRTGVKLGVFDLLTARFWSKDIKLRQKWDEAKQEHHIIKEFDIDPFYVLQIINLLEPGVDKEGKKKAPSIKRSDILSMRHEQAKDAWDRAVSGLASVLRIIKDECGILVPSLVPYTTMLIPMAAVWSSVEKEKGYQAGSNRIKILRWLWCSSFGARYENAPNSQAAKDYGELIQWLSGGNPPESVTNFNLVAVNLRGVGPRQRAVYRSVMSIILNHGAKDFYKRGKITSQLIYDKENPVDDHHIFPQAYLNEKKVNSDLRDCVLNRTYIDRLTNRSLKRKAPSDYFNEMREEHGIQEADSLLESHALPYGEASPLLRDDFDGFLNQREAILMKEIGRLTDGE